MNSFLKFNVLIFTFFLLSKCLAQNNVINFNEKRAKIEYDYSRGFSGNNIEKEILSLFDVIFYENSDFHIPSSSEISKIVNSTYTIPSKKIKEKCDKTYTCSRSDKSFIINASAKLYFALGLSNYKNFSHPHKCSNCLTWSDEYKRKVACHKCKDERLTFCGKTVVCPVCNGKGFNLVTENEKNNLTYSEYLDGNNIKIKDWVFYYDNPKDFGYFNIQELKKISFNSESFFSTYYDVLFSTSLLLLEGGWSVKKMHEDYVLQLEKKDQVFKVQIDSLLELNNYSKAANLYSELNYKSKEYYDKIKKNIVKNNMNFENQYAHDFILISDNKAYFDSLNIGIYTYKIDTLGNVYTLDNIKIDKLKAIPYYKYYGLYSEFNINVNSTLNVKIELTYNLTPNQSERVQTSDGSLIGLNCFRTKYFKMKLLKGSYLHWTGSRYTFKTERNSNLSRKEIVWVEKRTVNKNCNSIKLYSYDEDVIVKKLELSNRRFSAISKSALLFSGLSWSIFRILENKKIN
jgi:hypothetical protein